MKNIRIGEAFSRAWEGTKNNWVMLLILGGIYFGISLSANRVTGPGHGGGALWVALGRIVSSIVNMVFVFLLLKFSLRVAEQNGAKVELFSEMELSGDEVVRYFLTSLLKVLVLVAALAACMVPVAGVAMTVVVGVIFGGADAWSAFTGPLLTCLSLAFVVMVYLGLSLSQMMYACLHQGLGPVESLAESWRLTENVKGDLLLLVIASLGLLFAGMICLLVGMIPALMVIILVQPFVYYSLLEQSGPRPGSQRV
jgi:hypothetical protein